MWTTPESKVKPSAARLIQPPSLQSNGFPVDGRAITISKHTYFHFSRTYFDFNIDYGTLRFFSSYKFYWEDCNFLTRPAPLPEKQVTCCAASASRSESSIGLGTHLDPSPISSLSSTRINLSPFTKDFRGEWHLNESLQFIKAVSSEIV